MTLMLIASKYNHFSTSISPQFGCSSGTFLSATYGSRIKYIVFSKESWRFTVKLIGNMESCSITYKYM